MSEVATTIPSFRHLSFNSTNLRKKAGVALVYIVIVASLESVIFALWFLSLLIAYP